MERDEWILIIWALLVLTAVSIALLAYSVSAWPYQLNLTNGELIDLNSSNLNETNFTIYVVHQTTTINNTNLVSLNYTNITQVTYTNITYANYTYPNATIHQNITNVSYFNVTNVTCFNCTYHYNSTSLFNDTVLADYLKTAEFNSYKDQGFLLVSDFNSTHATFTEESVTSNIGLWIVSILAALLALTAVFLIWRASQ